MKGHNYGLCLKCEKIHLHPKGAGVLRGSHQTPTHIKKRADAIRGKKRPLLSLKFHAEGNPNWKADTTNNGTGHVRAHRWFECPTGYVRHHIDKNPLNNSPENIKIMPMLEHQKLHHPKGMIQIGGVKKHE
jgi:hypothetical protein